MSNLAVHKEQRGAPPMLQIVRGRGYHRVLRNKKESQEQHQETCALQLAH